MVPIAWLIVKSGRPRQHHPRPLPIILSRDGEGGPINKFRGLLWSSTDPTTFEVPPVFKIPPISRSCGFCSPPFFKVPPTFGVSGLPPNFWRFRPISKSRRFFEVWLSPKVWLSPMVCPSPKVCLPPDPQSVCHPPHGLAVTRLWSVRQPTLVCLSPDPRSVHHLVSVCPSLDFGLSIARSTVCLSPDFGLSVALKRVSAIAWLLHDKPQGSPWWLN